MKGFLIGTSFSAAFVLGVLVGGHGSVGISDAKAAKWWEYRCGWARSDSALADELNEQANDGWELVTVAHSGNAPYYCMRR